MNYQRSLPLQTADHEFILKLTFQLKNFRIRNKILFKKLQKMAPRTRRSMRLKALEDSNGIEEKVEPEKIEEEGEEDEEEVIDLEGLVAQTYEFMMNKARNSKRKDEEREKKKLRKHDSVSVDLSDVIKLSSSRE